MADAYEEVKVGGLKLKGITLKKEKTKKRKIPLNKDNEDGQDKQDEHLTSKSSQSAISFKAPTKTPAQIAFEQTQKKRQSEKIKLVAAKTHKEKVEEFNKYLGALSEHHDIPKVGPG